MKNKKLVIIIIGGLFLSCIAFYIPNYYEKVVQPSKEYCPTDFFIKEKCAITLDGKFIPCCQKCNGLFNRNCFQTNTGLKIKYSEGDK